MAYGDFKDLKRRTQLDKVLKDKAFAIAIPKGFEDYKRSKGSGIENEIKENQQLANELHKPINRKFKKRKVYSSFKENIWGADLADMQLISKYNKGIRYLLCTIDLFSKYAFVALLKNKKGTTIVNAFQNILDSSKRKPNSS